jgi:hypothetical protein
MSIETFRCGACGQSGVRRSPDQRFCSDRCEEYVPEPILNAPRPSNWICSKTVKNSHFSTSKNNGLQGPKSDFFDVPLANWRVVAGPPGTIGTNPWQSIIDASARKRSRRAAVSASAPLNLLGGYRWPGAGALDRDTMRKVLRAEVAESPAS